MKLPGPDLVARWVCVVFGAVLVATTVLLAAFELVERSELHTPEVWGGGVALGAALVWYGGRGAKLPRAWGRSDDETD